MKSKLSHMLKKPTLSKIQTLLSTKLLLALLLLSLLLLLLLNPKSQPPIPKPQSHKLPQSLASTIIHYATLNTTPQQTLPEISLAAQSLLPRSPCRFLVFGLGLDSPMWASLNHAGLTIFLEEDQSWIAKVTSQFPFLQTYHVRYQTKVRDADRLIEIGKRPPCSSWVSEKGLRDSECELALKGLPEEFYEGEWDLIMVDAPTGWVADAPGRMGAIYMAAMAARARRGGAYTDVFVHDVDRRVEDVFSKMFLCEGYMVEQVGRLRHFRVPSFRNKEEVLEFCPSVL